MTPDDASKAYISGVLAPLRNNSTAYALALLEMYASFAANYTSGQGGGVPFLCTSGSPGTPAAAGTNVSFTVQLKQARGASPRPPWDPLRSAVGSAAIRRGIRCDPPWDPLRSAVGPAIRSNGIPWDPAWRRPTDPPHPQVSGTLPGIAVVAHWPAARPGGCTVVYGVASGWVFGLTASGSINPALPLPSPPAPGAPPAALPAGTKAGIAAGSAAGAVALCCLCAGLFYMYR